MEHLIFGRLIVDTGYEAFDCRAIEDIVVVAELAIDFDVALFL